MLPFAPLTGRLTMHLLHTHTALAMAITMAALGRHDGAPTALEAVASTLWHQLQSSRTTRWEGRRVSKILRNAYGTDP